MLLHVAWFGSGKGKKRRPNTVRPSPSIKHLKQTSIDQFGNILTKKFLFQYFSNQSINQFLSGARFCKSPGEPFLSIRSFPMSGNPFPAPGYFSPISRSPNLVFLLRYPSGYYPNVHFVLSRPDPMSGNQHITRARSGWWNHVLLWWSRLFLNNHLRGAVLDA